MATDLTVELEIKEMVVREKQGLYALRVRDDRFEDVHIDDGDIVLVRPCQELVGDGQYLLMIDGQNQIRHFRRLEEDGDGTPASGFLRLFVGPQTEPVGETLVHCDRVEVQGRVIAVIRHV